ARRFLEIVFRHTERLGRLLNDLMDLSNIELGRVALKLAPTRLDEAVDAVLAIIGPKAKSGKVGLRSQLPRDLPPVPADRDRLVQILINLVDNAVKYTPEGGRVTVRVQEPADGWIEVDVVDTGIGIPPSDLPRITERFYRVDKARSRELGGTGLGLAIVKHLVFAHGGQLKIESEPGRGTTVRVWLNVGGLGAAPRDFPLRDARLVGDDEARVEARALAGERRDDVGHEHGVAGCVDDRPIVLGAGEGATPVQEQGALRGGHRATVPRSHSPSPEFRR